jgi:PAS domain S-box-containing protein
VQDSELGDFVAPHPADTAQNEIEVILLRQLASYLAMPVFITDNDGILIYFNEPAEDIIGRQYDQTDSLSLDDRFQAFRPVDDSDAPVSAEEMPLALALSRQCPIHTRFWLHGFDGTRRYIEAMAFPLVGQAGRRLGAVAFFWEIDRQ